MISVIQLLLSRGLPFRGENEVLGVNYNEKCLRVIELISEYNVFLKLHIGLHGNKDKGHPFYLSKTMCNKVISLLKNGVRSYFIMSQIKEAKYFSIILVSAPDLSFDHLTIILRYCTFNKAQERLLHFNPIISYRDQSIFLILEEF